MGIAGKRGFEPHKWGPGSAGRPTIVGHLNQPFFGGSNATLANASRRTAGRPLGDPSSRVHRLPPSFGRFVVSVEPRVVCVGSRRIAVELGGKYLFRGQFLALPNTELEAYLAKVRVASSSLVSRSTP
jgi:hypothetical protein